MDKRNNQEVSSRENIKRNGQIIMCGACYIALVVLISFSCERRITDPIIIEPPDSIGVDRWPWEDIGLNDKYSLRMVKSGEYVYVAAGVDGVWRLNREDRWEFLGLKDPRFGQATTFGILALDVYEGEIFTASLSAIPIDTNQFVGVWRLRPNTSEWVPSDSGIRVPTWRSSGVMDIVRSPHNPEILVTGRGAIFQSNNGGEIWDFKYPESRDVSRLAFRLVWHPIAPNVVWGPDKTNRFQASLLHSTDGGSSWESIHSLPGVPGDNGFHSMAFDTMDPNIIYIGTEGAIIKSTNGGQNWISREAVTPLFIDSPGATFREVVTHLRREGVFFAVADTNVYFSEDAGETVYLLPSPTNRTIFSMIYDTENNWLLVGSYEGVFRLREPLNVPRERYK